MNYRFIRTSQFERALKSFLKKHPDLRDIILNKLTLPLNNPKDPKLKTHELKGNLKGLLAASVNYEYRVIFYVEEDLIYLLNIGSHDEVY